MVLIAVTGNLGSGKTLYMTREAYYYRVLGYTLYTNYKLKGLNYHLLKEPTDIIRIGLQKYPLKKAVFLDEGYLWFDSYTKSAQKLQFLRNLTNITRKMGLVVIISTQTLNQISKRTRLLFDYIIQPEFIFQKGKYYMRVNTYAQNTISGIDTLKTYTIPRINRFFKYYDTKEIINDFVKDFLPTDKIDINQTQLPLGM